jgi:hypothetical protein
MSSLTRTLEALDLAACWLTQTCTQCTCPPAAVLDLDVDPDCPGLHPAADGCLAHAHLAAGVALADAGIPAPPGVLPWLRNRVLAMRADLVDDLEAVELIKARHSPRREVAA